MSTVFFFPNMFKNHLEGSDLKLPEDFENYEPEEYTHFHVFMTVHLAQPIEADCIQSNANIIASIPDDKIKLVTYPELLDMGLVFGNANYIV